MLQTSTGKKLFQKKPLGRRWHLMSEPTGFGEFSTTTSGTERKRGFVGIVSFLREPLSKCPQKLFLLYFYHFHNAIFLTYKNILLILFRKTICQYRLFLFKSHNSFYQSTMFIHIHYYKSFPCFWWNNRKRPHMF